MVSNNSAVKYGVFIPARKYKKKRIKEYIEIIFEIKKYKMNMDNGVGYI